MKKEITILQENSSPLVLGDTDERDLKTYTNDLSKILENNNVTLLHTSSCSVIIRPHKISSIIVREFYKEPKTEETKIIEDQPQETKQDDSLNGTITD